MIDDARYNRYTDVALNTKAFEHERLRETLGKIQGRFLLSYDDSEKIRELYKGYEIIATEKLNGINNRQSAFT